MKVSNEKAFIARKNPMSLTLTFCLGILVGTPVNASFPYPNSPLQTGSRVPANLMLVLDDSGSMASDFMPDTVPAINVTNNFRNQTYTRNTVYYNPSITYRPWRTSAGGRFADTPYNAAYTSTTLLTGSVNLGASQQVFYIPKVGITDYADGSQYYRYRLNTNGTADRSIYTAGAWAIDVSFTGFSWTDSNNVVFTRTLAEEQQNFATWYSFHRTRNKVAKAGVSEAFSDLGEDIRVGFNTIWNRNTYNIPVGSDDGLFRDLGASTNRSTWYNRLQAADANGNTPLLPALTRTGDYFSDTSATGPYGPQTAANQLTCRQNFTIFTTDGYWNNGTAAVGNSDNTAGATITNPTGGSYTYAATRPYMDAAANTLADVAMQYWKTDLRSDLINNVPTTTANPAFWQHMVTFGISIGAKGILDPIADLPLLISGAKVWTDPIANTGLERIDDLFHASVNGRGSFVAATDPTVLAEALKSALASIVGRVGSSSNVSANSVSVGSNTRVYQASYITGQWTGELSALPIVGNQVGGTADWTASQNIPAFGARNIVTMDGSIGATFPTTAQDTYLTTGIANYIKGDRSGEVAVGGAYRDRIKIFGDIINSSPAYSSDSNTVFIGSNDGMLHAFDGTTGVEKFAYVPGIINLADLKSLADNPYDHRYLVDGPVVVSTQAETTGKNILISSLGRGGKGVFSLDVTNPSAFTTANVLWEAGGTDAYMGNVISRPVIAKVNYNNEMAVLVSNGINSTNDSPALFIYGLESGVLLAKLTPTNSAGVTAIGNNGLSAATGVDVDNDDDVDYVYAGDMQGNVWKFDLTSSDKNLWNVGNTGKPLFTAKDAGGIAQPITGGLGLGYDTEQTLWIYFGTGRYVTAGDPSTTSVQTWYGIKDLNAVITGRSELKERKVAVATTFDGKKVRAFEPQVYNDMVGKNGWYIDFVNPPYTTAEKLGERVVGTPIVRGTSVVISSIIPSLDPCASGGSGYVNVVDAYSGSSGYPGALSYFDINGIAGYSDDKVTDANGNSIAIGSVDLGVFMPTDALILAGGTNELVVVGGSQGGTGSVPFRGTRSSGRISWHELINN